MCETNEENPRQDIRSYAGMGTRSIWISTGIALGLISLAGIPPLAGFLGKFFLLKTYLEQPHPFQTTLITIAILGIVCSFFFYFSILRTIYFGSAPAGRIIINNLTKAFIAAIVVKMIVLGIFPALWGQSSEKAVRFLFP
jgi:NADH-quinone oxidoreductase subunit N